MLNGTININAIIKIVFINFFMILTSLIYFELNMFKMLKLDSKPSDSPPKVTNLVKYPYSTITQEYLFVNNIFVEKVFTKNIIGIKI